MAQALESLMICSENVTEQMGVLALAVLPISLTPAYIPYNPYPPPPKPQPNTTQHQAQRTWPRPRHHLPPRYHRSPAQPKPSRPHLHISNPQNPQAPKLKTNEENGAHSESVRTHPRRPAGFHQAGRRPDLGIW